MKLTIAPLILALTITATATAGDIRSHYIAPSLDVYVDSSADNADVPGATARHYLTVSVKSTDQYAVALSVRVMVRLDDVTRIVKTGVQRNNADGLLVFRFSTPRRVVEIVAIDVNNLHAADGDTLSRVPNEIAAH